MSVIICLFPVMTLAFSFSQIWRLLQLGGLKVSHMVLQRPSYHLRILPCRATGKYVKEGLGLDSRVLILGRQSDASSPVMWGKGSRNKATGPTLLRTMMSVSLASSPPDSGFYWPSKANGGRSREMQPCKFCLSLPRRR